MIRGDPEQGSKARRPTRQACSCNPDVGLRKILSCKQQRFIGSYRESVAETVPIIQLRRMPSLAESAIAGSHDLALLRGHRHQPSVRLLKARFHHLQLCKVLPVAPIPSRSPQNPHQTQRASPQGEALSIFRASANTCNGPTCTALQAELRCNRLGPSTVS